jgi:hypothetical protein
MALLSFETSVTVRINGLCREGFRIVVFEEGEKKVCFVTTHYTLPQAKGDMIVGNFSFRGVEITELILNPMEKRLMLEEIEKKLDNGLEMTYTVSPNEKYVIIQRDRG